MKSLAIKVPNYEASLAATEMPKKIDYPCVYLSSEAMPELEGKEVGEEWDLVVRVRLESKSKELAEPARCSLEILSYEAESGTDGKAETGRSLS